MRLSGGARPGSGKRVRILALAAVAAMLVGACGAGGPILANPPVSRPAPPPTATPATVPADPQPIAFPRDDGPHDRLTEWWYYTGHLRDASGRTYGFEFVVFRAERGAVPVSWASHLAITDEHGQRFLYAQRAEIGPQVDRSPRAGGVPAGFDLSVGGAGSPVAPSTSPAGSAPAPSSTSTPATGAGTAATTAWTMDGSNGRDSLSAEASAPESVAAGSPGGFGLRLELSPLRPPTLHDGNGWIDFGPAGGSYYYSRTRMAAAGTLTLDGRTFTVDGEAWFDHQWGDFIAVGGGWDWFAVNLADGTDLTLSVVRDARGGVALRYGTLVRPDGTVVHLGAGAFQVVALGQWRSARTGAVYPAGWRVTVPGEDLSIALRPTVADQELDTRATTGVAYWEGSQVVTASHLGRSTAGEAYVELTGYAPAGTPGQ